MNDINTLLTKPEFPRSSRCDADWLLDNQMGPNAVWLTEWLTEALTLEPGMRVLDLGCGRAMSSIFLATEFGVQVWATDLWIAPDGNWQRAQQASMADRVYPLRAEAHALPFAKGFFDAVVSIDAYQYFGTDELYLNYLSRFIRPGGVLGVVMPGLMQPIDGRIPDHLTQAQPNGKVFWEDECRSFKTQSWWQRLWQQSTCVTAVQVDTQPDGWRHWRDFEKALELSGKNIFPSDVHALDADQGRYLGFVRIVARRTETDLFNSYDPSLGVQVGVDG